MKKILILTLLLAFIGIDIQAQSWTPINGRQRFMSGLGIPVRDTVTSTTADSAQIVIRPQDGKVWYRYKSAWRVVGITNISWDSVTNKPTTFSTTYALSNDVRDSIQSKATITNNGDFRIVTGTGTMNQLKAQGKLNFYPDSGIMMISSEASTGYGAELDFDNTNVNGTQWGLYGGSSSLNGMVLYRYLPTQVELAYWDIDRYALRSDVKMAWSSTLLSFQTPDIALSREGAGLLQVNNGTTNNYADLKLKALTSTDLAGTGTRIVYADSDGKLSASGTLTGYLLKSDSLSGGYTAWDLTKKKIDSLGSSMGNLNGKNWIIYGDSYSDNLTLDYPGRVRDRLGLNATTKAVAGARIYTMVDTLKNNLIANPTLFQSFDIFSLHIGVNDFAASDRPLGDINSAVEADNIAGQLKYFIETVLANNPMIKMFIITPPEADGGGVAYQSTNSQGWTLRDMSLLYSQICALYSVQCIDLYNLSQLNLETIPTMLPDGLHPGFPEGRNFMGDIVAQSFLSNANKGKYADTYLVGSGYVPKYDGLRLRNGLMQDNGNQITVSGALLATSSISANNNAIDSTIFLRVRNSQNDLYLGNNSISGAFFPQNSIGAAVLQSQQPFEVTINGQKKTTISTSGLSVIGNISTVNGSISTDTGSVNVDSGNVNINIGSLNIDTGSVNVTQGNVNVSSGTPLLTLTASTTGAFHGIELKNGSNIDAFFKHNPATAELRISSGRSVAWGGYTTFYGDQVERARIAPSGRWLFGTTTDNTVDIGQFNGSIIADGRTRLAGAFVGDIGGVGNNTGIIFAGSSIFSANGSAGYAVKNLGDATNRWGTYFGSVGDFTGSVTASKIIGNSSAPSISLGANITGSVSVTGTDMAGTVTVTVTGVSSLATLNELFTLTYNSAYSSTPHVVWSPASANAAALLQAAGGLYLKNSGTSSFQIATVNSYSTPASQTYTFTYHVIQ